MIPIAKSKQAPITRVPRVGGGDPKILKINRKMISVPRVGGGDPQIHISRDKDIKCSPRRRG